jgi:hypothetical protein
MSGLRVARSPQPVRRIEVSMLRPTAAGFRPAGLNRGLRRLQFHLVVHTGVFARGTEHDLIAIGLKRAFADCALTQI